MTAMTGSLEGKNGTTANHNASNTANHDTSTKVHGSTVNANICWKQLTAAADQYVGDTLSVQTAPEAILSEEIPVSQHLTESVDQHAGDTSSDQPVQKAVVSAEMLSSQSLTAPAVPPRPILCLSRLVSVPQWILRPCAKLSKPRHSQ